MSLTKLIISSPNKDGNVEESIELFARIAVRKKDISSRQLETFNYKSLLKASHPRAFFWASTLVGDLFLHAIRFPLTTC
ncbi:hypothetical protein, partial [Vibrio superstes]|uniref:hypothetical protein n=1 Tax=Vibrio superstes TaxID=198815 RepID=UPI001C996A84